MTQARRMGFDSFFAVAAPFSSGSALVWLPLVIPIGPPFRDIPQLVLPVAFGGFLFFLCS